LSDSYSEEYIGLDEKKYIGDLLAEFKVAKDRSKGQILHYKLIFKKKLFRESDEVVTESMFGQLSYVQVCLFIMKPYIWWLVYLVNGKSCNSLEFKDLCYEP